MKFFILQEFKFQIKNLFIAIDLTLMLINPSIYMAAESPIDIQEFFVGSETMDEDNLKIQKGNPK